MTAFIKCHNLSFTYDNLTQDIISGVDTGFHQGWTSICGPNGCGKTTLLKLIAGSLQAVSGSVQIKGTLVAVPQQTEVPPAGLEEFFCNHENRCVRLRDRLGIQDDWQWRWSTLSIGERKRLQIGTALGSNPDILLVDEPTNHVDSSTRQVIHSILMDYSGVGILISHDRLLLNELCSHTAFLEAGELILFATSYDTAKSELLAHYGSLNKDKEKLKKELRHTAHASQLQSEKVAQGKAKLSKRGLSKKDHDAKERINRAKLFGADLSDSQKKRNLSLRAERLGDQIGQIKTKKEYNLGVFFEKTPRVKTLHLPQEVIRHEFLTLHQPEIILSPGDKLAITGDNGSGKSTLLKHWLSKFPPSFVYGPQELSNSEMEVLAADYAALDNDTRGKVNTLISCFGSDPKSIVSGSIPSPGVWQKMVIARAIVDGAPLLILDEPTNHMDLAAIEVLEEALIRYQGTLICISHDQVFIEKICTRRLHLLRNQGESEAVCSALV